MFNINDILNAAQGGQGVNNIAQQFGLSPEQTQAAIQAVIPAFSQGMQNQAAAPGGLESIIGALTGGIHQQSFQNPAAAQSPAAQAAGGDMLSQIFGNNQIVSQIAQHAAQSTGISPQILQQMMPTIASMIAGGMFHSMQNQGLGNVLGQLAQAATQPGGLGSMLGQGAAPQQPQAAGGLGGMLGGLLGGLFGGNQQAASPAGGMAGAGMSGAGMQNPAVQMGIDALTKMMQGGVSAQQAHVDGLQNILNQFTQKR